MAVAFGCKIKKKISVWISSDCSSLIFECFVQIKCAFIMNLIPCGAITSLVMIINSE